jgi:hypothetical protein
MQLDQFTRWPADDKKEEKQIAAMNRMTSQTGAAAPSQPAPAPRREPASLAAPGMQSVLAANGGSSPYMPVPMMSVPPTMSTSPSPPASMSPYTAAGAVKAFSGNRGGGSDIRPVNAFPTQYSAAPRSLSQNLQFTTADARVQAPSPLAMTQTNPPAPAPAQTPQSTDRLLGILRSGLFAPHRAWAAEQLANLDWRTSPQVVDALLLSAHQDPEPSVRAGCIRALVAMRVPASRISTTLQSLLGDADPLVRQEAARGLASLGAKS